MEIGFTHHPAEHYARHVWLVREAEQMGFHQAWIPDQTFHRDPYVVLAAIGSKTSQIQLGLAVTNPYTRHPTVTARAIGTVSEFAPGRLTLGIGAGNQREVVSALGLADGHAAGRAQEMVLVVRALLAGERIDHQGKYFQCSNVALDFESKQTIPMYVAARGPAFLRVAGRVADGVIVGSIATPDAWKHAMEGVQAGLRSNGRTREDVRLVSWLSCEITRDRVGRLNEERPRVARILATTPMESLASFGLDADAAAVVRNAYFNEGAHRAEEIVDETQLDAFAIVGDAVYCRERVAELTAFGIDQVSLLMRQGASVEEHREALATFAAEILPTL